MRKYTLGASLACFVMSTVAVSVALAETGADCYKRLGCGSKATLALCYGCCNNGCTDMSGCQTECDKKFSGGGGSSSGGGGGTS